MISYAPGHIALAAACIRIIVEVKAGVRNGHSGIGDGVYRVFDEELPLVDDDISRVDLVHFGLCLVDGADQGREALHDDAGVAAQSPDGDDGDADDGSASGEE